MTDAPTAQLLVMAKYPSPGAVKTRLAAQVGDEAACRVYQAFLHDLAARLAGLRLPVTWAVWPPDAPWAGLLGDAHTVAQEGRDLGERMDAAIRACAARNPLPVITIGVDAPHLPLERLREAAATLAAGTDVVIGPAADGGYYLVGMRRPCSALFEGVVWGSDRVLASTLERVHAVGLSVGLLAGTFDVDDGEGIEALSRLIASGEVRLPHTAAALRALAARSP